MKTALLLFVLLGAGKDELVPVQVKDISISVPGSWKRSIEDGSVKYSSPNLEARFLVNADKVLTQGMAADVCRKKILAKMGPEESWTLLTVGGAPAARRLDTDAADGPKKGEIQTYTFVGCDGATTWSLVFHMDAKRKDKYGPLAEKVAQSVKFTAQGGM